MLRSWFNTVLLLLCLCGITPLMAQPVCSDLFAEPSGVNPNLGANGISPFDLASVPWQSTPWPASGTVLSGGNYYFGSLNVGNNYQLSVAAGEKAVIYVNDTFDVRNFLQLNTSGETRQLTLVVRANVAVNNLADINALIFAAGAISINAQNVVIGGLAANGAISVGNSTVIRNAQAINELNLPGLCTATTSIEPLAHYPLDLCSAAATGVITDLTGNYPATAINVGAVSDGQVLQAAGLSATGNDYISVPAAALNGRSNFSLSMWFRLDAGSGFRELFSASSNSSDTELELYINSSNEVRAGLKGTYHTFGGGSSSPVVANNQWTQVTLSRSGSQLCLYLNDQLVRCVTSSSASLNVVRAAAGIWWRANGSLTDDFRGDIDEVLVFNQALSPTQVSQLYLNQQAGNSYDGTARVSSCAQCLSDDFNSGLAADSWVTSTSSGNFTPQIVNGRLRMTQAVANQSTSATYQRLYPASDNLVIVEFDYYAWSSQGGTGADGLAVILSDATVTPQPGSFGGSLGYAQRDNGDAGFAGGWLGIALDEYGNFSNPTEGRNAGPGFRPQSVSVRGAAAGNYRYLTGTAANLNPRIDVRSTAAAAPGHRYRITVDSRQAGQAMVSVQRDSGSGFITLIEPFNALAFNGQSPVPENFFLSFTGSTGGSNNNHELDNLSICALRSSAVGQQIDHFEFDYSGQALTCKPETFTVRACKNASCSELITEPVTASLSPANSGAVNWLGGNVINFSGGQTSVSLSRTVAGTTTIGVSGSVPTTRPLSQTLCRAGNGNLTAAACTISFADSGLVFDVPNGIANLPDNNIVLSAVRKDNASQQCVPAFANVTRSVAFWSDYITPDSNGRPVSWPVQVNNTNVGQTEADRQTLALVFNAQGQANIAVNYADAGQMQLNGRYTGSVATDDAGLIMNGADQFIRRPLGLCVQTAGECAAADASCPAFHRAGEDFTLTLSGRAWQSGSTDLCTNPVTPNFSRNAITLNHTLVAPADGVAGSIATTAYNHSRQLQAQTQLQQQVSEVGVFRFGTAAFNYLSMTEPVPAAVSQPTGRFYPASISVDRRQAAIPMYTPACGDFSYLEQPFAIDLEFKALNATGVVTENYFGDFASANFEVIAETAEITTRLMFEPPSLSLNGYELEWIDGHSIVEDTKLRLLKTTSKDGPYMINPQSSEDTRLRLGVKIINEQDDVLISPVDSVFNSDAKQIGDSAADFRFGRLVLENAYGPENELLPITVKAEYWNGAAFVTNPQDNCSPLNDSRIVSPIIFDPEDSGSTTITADSNPLWPNVNQGSSVINGASQLWLNAPDPVLRGTGNVEYQLNDHPWLQYDWNADGGFDENPTAEFMFGRFRGNPRQIYWRELFQ